MHCVNNKNHKQSMHIKYENGHEKIEWIVLQLHLMKIAPQTTLYPPPVHTK